MNRRINSTTSAQVARQQSGSLQIRETGCGVLRVPGAFGDWFEELKSK